MKVVALGGQMYDSNIYLIKGDSTSTLIDAGTGFFNDQVIKSVEESLGSSELDKLVLSHRHFDHTGGAADLAKRFDVPVYAHSEAKSVMEEAKADLTGATMFGGEQKPVKVTALNEGDTLEMGGEEFMVFHLPGHSPCSMGLFNPELSSLFCGDVIFCDGGVGRWDLDGGDLKKHKTSIRRVVSLEAANLYPGHGRYEEGKGHMEAQMAMASLQMWG